MQFQLSCLDIYNLIQKGYGLFFITQGVVEISKGWDRDFVQRRPHKAGIVPENLIR